MKEIGEYLRKVREEQKISLNQINEQTKIKVSYLEAIEVGEFQILPGEVYCRGFIAGYANALGLNSQEVLKRYDDLKNHKNTASHSNGDGEAKEIKKKPKVKPENNQKIASKQAKSTIPEKAESGGNQALLGKKSLQRRDTRKEKRHPDYFVRSRSKLFRHKGLFLSIFLLLMIIILVLVFIILPQTKAKTETLIENTNNASEITMEIKSNKAEIAKNQAIPKKELTTPVPPKQKEKTNEAIIETTAPAQNQGAETATKPITLQANFLGDVWLLLKIDGDYFYSKDGIILNSKSGQTIWQATEEIKIRIGNPMAIRLTLNGKLIEKITRLDDACTLKITSNKVLLLKKGSQGWEEL